MRFLDVNNPPYRQYWFINIEGIFLFKKGLPNSWYHYFPKTGAKNRWTRHYDVDVQEGQRLIKYVRKGRVPWWEVHEVQNGELVKIEDHPGIPPHIQAFVDKMRGASV
jgi:hypothetical protein